MPCVTRAPAAFRLLLRVCAAAALAAGAATPGLAIAGPAAAAPQRPDLPGATGEIPGLVSARAQAAAPAAAASAPGWLREINRYRRATGIPAVKANAGWVTGI